MKTKTRLLPTSTRLCQPEPRILALSFVVAVEVNGMKKRSMLLKRVAGAFLLVLLGGLSPGAAHASGNAQEKHSDVKICYIQFYLSTFVPLTRKNISRHSNCYKIAADSDAAVALIGLLSHARPISGDSEAFDDELVRVMLSEPSSQEPYYVDRNGVILRGKITAKLSAWQKAAVQIILNASYKKVRQKRIGNSG